MFLFSDITIPTGLTLLSTLIFGFVLGLRHSLEPDHIAAVSTIVSDGKSFLRASLTGCLWGVGHTLSLLIVGGIIILLKLDISASLEKPVDLLVALALIFLGVNALWRLYKISTAKEEAEIESHSHQHRSRSLIVGMIHGLAGSGALTLLIGASISPPSMAFFFLIIFGIGSIAGMTLASVFLTVPLRFTFFRYSALHYCLRGFAGIFSLVFGFWILYDLQF